MNGTMSTTKIHVTGMTCGGCEAKIERRLNLLNGMEQVKASYAQGMVSVTYDASKLCLEKIKQTITDLDYVVSDSSEKSDAPVNLSFLTAAALVILGLILLINHFDGFRFFRQFPEAKAGMSYAAVFLLGLFSSIHCIGMCGGITLSQCLGDRKKNKTGWIRSSFFYHTGRIISYTVIGGIVGALGSVINLNGMLRGVVALIAGVFMIIMGLNMLQLFPWLRRLGFRLPKGLTCRTNSNSPLYVGLLNGLMPCGPLQAMQLYALSTGSSMQGAFSMFLFALGTSPLLFGLGAVSSLLSKRFTAKMMAASALLVIVLGFGMLNTGINMSGFLSFGTQTSDTNGFSPVIKDGYQIVTLEVRPGGYAPITVKKGVPVRFNLHAESKNLNGCNNAILIPKYGIQKSLKAGDNIVEFTPEEAGVFSYSCWMNMIRSSITVVD